MAFPGKFILMGHGTILFIVCLTTQNLLACVFSSITSNQRHLNAPCRINEETKVKSWFHGRAAISASEFAPSTSFSVLHSVAKTAFHLNRLLFVQQATNCKWKSKHKHVL